MWKKLIFFFDVFPVKRDGGRARRHGTTPTNFQFFGLAPGGTIVPFTPAHSFARTHARHRTETEIDFPVGHTPQPPTYKTSLKADKEVGG